MRCAIPNKRQLGIQLVAMVLCALLLIAMGACTPSTTTTAQQDKDLVVAEAKRVLEPYKSITREDLSKGHRPIAGDDQTEVFSQWGIDPYEMCAIVLSTYDYQIDDVVIDGDAATVQVTVRFVDVAAAMQRVIANGNTEANVSAFGELYRSDDGSGTVQLVYKELLDAIANEKSRTSAEVKLMERKVDGTWFVDASSLDAIVSAAFGAIA